MNAIVDAYHSVQNDLPKNVKLVAVSKTKPNEMIMELYKAGQRVFGESKAQELTAKYEELPKDIDWHMIGHLQSNKVKYIAPFVALIHSVDSFKLLQAIDKEAHKNDRTIDCLLQIHIAEEETKFGFDWEELETMITSKEFAELRNIRITGLMCMATFTTDHLQIQREFGKLTGYFNLLKEKYFKENPWFLERSMGMSDDYPIAIEQGSTMVRVGSKLFGSR